MPTRGESYRFTGERRRKYLDALSRGAGRTAAARAAGVARSTISRHCDQHPQFAERVREAEHAADDAVVSAVYAKAIKGDVKAAALWLAARQPDTWSPQRRLTVQTDSVRERVEHAPMSAHEMLDVMRKLEVTGARPSGSAAALEAYLVASGELPAPMPAVLELVDVTEAEVVEQAETA